MSQAHKSSQNGMQGVFHTAAELTHRGFTVAVTSRNAYGADLLVTDADLNTAWTVQVKTNQDTSANFWLLNAHAETLRAPNHVYVFVGLRGNERPKFLAVPNRVVCANVCTQKAKGGTWYSFARDTKWEHEGEGWEEAFAPSEQVAGHPAVTEV